MRWFFPKFIRRLHYKRTAVGDVSDTHVKFTPMRSSRGIKKFREKTKSWTMKMHFAVEAGHNPIQIEFRKVDAEKFGTKLDKELFHDIKRFDRISEFSLQQHLLDCLICQ